MMWKYTTAKVPNAPLLISLSGKKKYNLRKMLKVSEVT